MEYGLYRPDGQRDLVSRLAGAGNGRHAVEAGHSVGEVCVAEAVRFELTDRLTGRLFSRQLG